MSSTSEVSVTLDAARPKWPLWLFVATIGLAGFVTIVHAAISTRAAPPDNWILALSLLAFVTSHVVVSVPGHTATVSASEVFVFATVLLFGPSPAVLTLAAAGLSISLRQRDRKIYRLIFNVAEPAVSVFIAGSVGAAVMSLPPFATPGAAAWHLVAASAGMSLTYFLCNTVLHAAAVSLETGCTMMAAWTPHAWYVGVNYYAAGSLAMLAVRGGTVDVAVLALLAPLLLLSYATYQIAASRVQDAEEHLRALEDRHAATIETLAVAVDAKDRVTHGHIRRVQRHTIAVARSLGIRDAVELKALGAASLLHDIGKLAVPDYLLQKPGTLDASELEQMQQHAATGASILSHVHLPYPVVPIVRHHHEQWGGTGYPDGLAGEGIPLGARILAVVDCFDALTSDRPYRRRLSDVEAAQILMQGRGTRFDPDLVDAFLRLLPALRQQDGPGNGEADPRSPTSNSPADRAVRDGSRRESLEQVDALFRDVAGRIGAAAEACLFLLDQRTPALVACAWTPSLAEVMHEQQIRVGEGLVGWVAAYRHTVANSPADIDLGDAAREFGLNVCTAVPVFAGDALAGVLTVYLHTPHKFAGHHVCRAGVLAQEIGRLLVTAECLAPRVPLDGPLPSFRPPVSRRDSDER